MFMSKFIPRGPRFGLHLNPKKCELFWPSASQGFPESKDNILRLYDGVSLLGSPIWGSEEFIINAVNRLNDQVKDNSDFRSRRPTSGTSFIKKLPQCM